MTTPRAAAPGAQTLARGLRALELVAGATEGMSVQELSAELDVHRSITSRLLTTLADFRLVTRGQDGRYRPGAGLAALATGVHMTLREAAEPILRDLAARLDATVSLLVVEGDEAVALTVVEPPRASFLISFRTGGHHPLGRGSAGIALLAALPPQPGEPEAVAEARRAGHARTYGEVEPGAYGVAAPIPHVAGMPTACINLITHRVEVADAAAPAIEAAAAELHARLS
ncbi:IclR family transcriptional regulator [Nocardioides nitrophenolicus]|uniref:IclR family transcriptional regulator n=1 Tax=Nocardioides nitrophenolicus TaxID=60489 RepID=UPI0019560B43|nr:helix-turn-helix domain-containing protein [Nocardioides nitrophenolicus]MBM7516090.1 DNA-binding IclR family transcriptional regulator [Nocardioides nitrophenolicus]